MWATCRVLVYDFARDGREQLPELGGQRVFGIVGFIVGGLGAAADGCGDVDLAYGRHKCDDLDAVRLLQVAFRDRARRNASYRTRSKAVSEESVRQSCSPMVSRALLRPPPLLALMPYFAR